MIHLVKHGKINRHFRATIMDMYFNVFDSVFFYYKC